MTALLLALFVACALAHPRGHFEVCQNDRETFCSEVTDHHEIRRCMQEHWAQLSQECQTAITEFVQEQHERVHAACGGDVDTFCADVKENFEQLRQCMSTNWESLSQECKDVLSHHREHHEEPHQEEPHQEEPHQEEPHQEEPDHPRCPMARCANDIHTLCPEADNKEAVHDCLKSNWASLSEDCHAAIEEMIRHNNAQAQQEQQAETQTSESSQGTEGMAHREGEEVLTEGNDVVVVEEPHLGTTTQPQPTPWYCWFTRLWWTYPVGLVVVIQFLACIRVRQIRRQEAEL